MHVVDGANEELKGEPGQRLINQCPGFGPDPVALEPDDDVDLRGVFGPQPQGFFPVGGFVGGVPGLCLAGFNLVLC